MICPKCNSEHNELRVAPAPHGTGRYCADCGRWLKWEKMAKNKAPAKAKKKSSWTDKSTWAPPEQGHSKPIFGRRHRR